MNKFMRMAIKEAKKGIESHHGGPFGAVIVKDGKVVGKGHNQVLKNNDPTCHGEIMAIHKACKNLKTFDLSGCELYTTGEPCPMCYAAILWANIDKVYYGCTIQDNENIGFRDKKFYEMQQPEFRNKVVKELDREKCLELFEYYNSLEHNLY
ncbi:MAG: nucleoside deaminase [Firmicutes bacterium]|nr:nucleoside deaminase [Candidatus Alectryobacillus merdavium]